ncbi:hypothetical protein HF264_36375 [Rhizobium leguminosarum]|uniref:hypothetical protein n=1 Tax=Rhizobium leguminosarum TaxID=384 RepID=UPI001C92A115|nr:hypothetical protein [Rhizobium leguminosarum]MBY2945075.1 hypothetical protein [Rhizobium leguminosarum]
MANRPPASVLLLEDEAIIAIDAEEMLAACGVSQVSTHGSEDAALAWLSTNTPDLAIIDARLKDGLCSGVAGHLVERADSLHRVLGRHGRRRRRGWFLREGRLAFQAMHARSIRRDHSTSNGLYPGGLMEDLLSPNSNHAEQIAW